MQLNLAKSSLRQVRFAPFIPSSDEISETVELNPATRPFNTLPKGGYSVVYHSYQNWKYFSCSRSFKIQLQACSAFARDPIVGQPLFVS